MKRLLGWGLVALSFLFLWVWAVSGMYLLGTLMTGGQITSVEGTPSAGTIWSTVAGVALLGSGIFILSKRSIRVNSF